MKITIEQAKAFFNVAHFIDPYQGVTWEEAKEDMVDTSYEENMKYLVEFIKENKEQYDEIYTYFFRNGENADKLLVFDLYYWLKMEER